MTKSKDTSIEEIGKRKHDSKEREREDQELDSPISTLPFF